MHFLVLSPCLYDFTVISLSICNGSRFTVVYIFMIYEHLVLDGELSACFQWYTISVSSGKMMNKRFHSHNPSRVETQMPILQMKILFRSLVNTSLKPNNIYVPVRDTYNKLYKIMSLILSLFLSTETAIWQFELANN